MPDAECRIAKLEQRVDDMEEMKEKINQIFEMQVRQRGFVAGVVFTVGAVASALTWFLNHKAG